MVNQKTLKLPNNLGSMSNIEKSLLKMANFSGILSHPMFEGNLGTIPTSLP